MSAATADSRASSPDLSIDELDHAIAAHAGRINAMIYAFLVMVREFDERGGYLRWSFASCADWLHWRCDLSHQAARERVRIAHALKSLPAIAAAFETGALSYSKVRALTRVATRESEPALVQFALGTTAARVEERVRQLRNGDEASVADAAQAHEARSVIALRDRRAGLLRMTVEMPLEQGELIMQALEKALNAQDTNAPEFAGASFQAHQADALVEIAREYLSGGQSATEDKASPAGCRAGTAEQYQVMVHVDAAALAGDGGRSDLPIETVRRLSCDGSVVSVDVDGDGEPVDVGRRRRTVPAAVRRALFARDRHCRFPGCHHTRFLDAHHIVHWSRGGQHTLDNLVLLCSRHHRLVHEGGYEMRRDQRNEWYFRRPDGRAVPAMGYRMEDVTDDVIDMADTTGGIGAPGPGGASAEASHRIREPAVRYAPDPLSVRALPPVHSPPARRAAMAARRERAG